MYIVVCKAFHERGDACIQTPRYAEVGKGFANHFVLLLQFHESRNAAEIEGKGMGDREEREEGERLL